MNCRVCEHSVAPFATAQVLARYDVRYFRCDRCGFIQTEPPYWLDEAYADAITRTDVGLVSRNATLSSIAGALIKVFFDPEGMFVDYGGGYGILVRLMRDGGLDFYRYDPLCANLFAKDYDVNPVEATRFELLTAFEVLEHLADPRASLAQMARMSDNIFFMTELVPPGNPGPDAWAYYGLDHGQHVALYSRRTLEFMAQELGLHLHTNGKSLHLFTRRRISDALFRWVVRHKISQLINLFTRRRSLQADDHARALRSTGLARRQPADSGAGLASTSGDRAGVP